MSKKKGHNKANPEKLKEDFEQWKASKEAKLWDDIFDIVNSNKDIESKDAESIENDFTLNYRFFLFKFQHLCEECKVPKRLKSNFLYINRTNRSRSTANILLSKCNPYSQMQRKNWRI